MSSPSVALWTGAVLFSFFMHGCANGPAPSLPSYVGPVPPGGSAKFESLLKQLGGENIHVGLLVINDTSKWQSPPALSKEMLVALTESLKDRLEAGFPVKVTQVLETPSDFKKSDPADPAMIRQLAKEKSLDFVIVAVTSSEEVEVIEHVPLGGVQVGGFGWTLGWQAQNYALAELALFDVKAGVPIVEANGRAWARLYRLNVPVKSNIYPIVKRNLLYPPIFPTEERAHDTLRGVAAGDAFKQAFMHLQEAWGISAPAPEVIFFYTPRPRADGMSEEFPASFG